MFTLHILSPRPAPSLTAPGLPSLKGFDVSAAGGGFIATGRGLTVTAMTIDAPYPDAAPLRACEGNLFWPKAAEVVAAHKSHVVLAASHPGEGWEARRAEMLALLGFAVEIADEVGATAIYCPNGVCVAPITRMIEAQRAIRADNWLEWIPEPFVSIRCVDQRAAPGGESDATFLSAGAAAFFGHEVAVRMTGRAGVPHAVTLFAIRHLMANGPVFQLGDEVPLPNGPVLVVSDADDFPGETLLLKESEGGALQPKKPEAPKASSKPKKAAKRYVWLNEWNFSTKFVERVDWESEFHLKEPKELLDLTGRYQNGELRDLEELPKHGYCEKPGKRNVPDVFRSGRLLFVSAKAKAVFEQFDLGASSFSPFELFHKDRKTKPEGEFFIFNLVAKKAALIVEAPGVHTTTRYDGSKITGVTMLGVTKDTLRVNETALDGVDIWLDSQIEPQVVFYSDRFCRACRAAKLKRMTFIRARVAEN